MRVCVIIQTPTYGGPHNQVLRLRDPLARLGWESVAILPEGDESGAARLREAGVEVATLPIHRLRKKADPRVHWRFLTRFGGSVRAIERTLAALEPDVVQVCGLMSLHGARAARRSGLPLVWQVLGTFPPPWMRRLLVPVVRRWADAAMCAGVATARAHPGLDRLGDRLVPFYPPVDTAAFGPDAAVRRRVRDLLGLRDDDVLVGTVGNRNRSKAHDVFVDVAHRILPADPRIVARIFGDLSEANRAEYEASVMRPAEAGGFLGSGRLEVGPCPVPVGDLLTAFDLFLLTSDAEGAPTVVIEAMACGLPVVTTDVGATRELVVDGETGRVVARRDAAGLAEAVLALAADPDRRRRFGEAGERRARERFSIEECAKRHLVAYDLARRRGSPSPSAEATRPDTPSVP